MNKKERNEKRWENIFPDRKGWLKGLRVDSIYRIKPDFEGIKLCVAWNGVKQETFINIEMDEDLHPDEALEKWLEERDRIYNKILDLGGFNDE